jgi:hypothetical protein
MLARNFKKISSTAYAISAIALLSTMTISISSCKEIEALSPDDIPNRPTFTFDLASQSTIDKIIGDKITVNISLSHASHLDIDYNVGVSGTATDTVDFDVPDTVSVPAGDTTATFDVTIYRDYIYEGDETIILTLADESEASTAGANPTHTLTIVQPIIVAASTLGTDNACAILRDQSVKCWGGAWGVTPTAVASLTSPKYIHSDYNYFYVTLADATVKRIADGAVTAAPTAYAGYKFFVAANGQWFDGLSWNPYEASTGISSTNGKAASYGGNLLDANGDQELTNIKYLSASGYADSAYDYTWLITSTGGVRWQDHLSSRLNGALATYTFAGITNARKVAVSGHYGCAVINDGSVYCGGASDTLTLKADISDVIDITASKTDETSTESYMCALISDGTVSCWSELSTVPYVVANLSNIIGLSDGYQTSSFVAVKNDHTIWKWATNDNTAAEVTGF